MGSSASKASAQQRRGGRKKSGPRRIIQPGGRVARRQSQGRRTASCHPMTTRSRSSRNVEQTPITPLTSSTGPYDANFGQILVDNGIFPYGHRPSDGRPPKKPRNWSEIQQTLTRRRPSLTSTQFSDGRFEDFQQADCEARRETAVRESVFPAIEGDFRRHDHRASGVAFSNLGPLTEEKLVPCNPDIYYGARPEQASRRVRDDLDAYIVPSSQHDLPLAASFFVELKGPAGNGEVLERQTRYNGAMGARGIQQLQSYGRDGVVYDDNAYTISSTYHGGTLKLFTTYLAAPDQPGGLPRYHMHQVNSWAMTGEADTFRRGATAYRNARDWTRERRDEAIAVANNAVV